MGTSIDRFLQRNAGEEPDTPETPDPVVDQVRLRAEALRRSRRQRPREEPDEIAASARLQTIVEVGPTSPVEARRTLALAARAKVPPSTVEGALDQVETEIWRSQFRPADLTRESPTLAAWLVENENHLAAASEDIGRLTAIERQIRDVGSVREARARRRYFAPAEDDEFGRALVRGGASTIDLIAGAVQTTDPRNRFQAASQRFIARVREGMAAVRESVGPARVQTIGEVQSFGDAIDYALAKTGEGLPTTLPVVGGAIVGGPVGAGAVAYALARGEARSELEQLGVSDEQTLQRWSSIIAGPVALLDTAMPYSVVKSVIRDRARRGLSEVAERGMVRVVTRQALKGAATEAGTESTQSVITSVSARNVADVPVDWHEVAAQAFEEGVGGGLIGGLFGGSSGVVVAGERQRVRESQRNPELVGALGEAMKDSPLARDVPEKMLEILERLSNGTPVETLYVPVEQWDSYWQGRNADPAAEAEGVLGDRRAYEAAREVGGDIPIPFARYAMKIAPSEHNAFFSAEVKLGLEDMNAREAAEAAARFADPDDAPARAETEAGRILATEPAEPLVEDARELGASAEEAAAYTALVGRWRRSAEIRIEERLNRQAKLEETPEWKVQADVVRAEVTAEAANDPVLRALTTLQEETQLGGEAVRVKLNDAALFSIVGPELHERLPRGVTGTAGEPGVVHPEVAAEMFGFRSARAMAEALANAESRSEYIERVTTQRMRERYGEKLTEEDVQDAALAAAYSQERAEVLRQELAFLAPEQAVSMPTREDLAAEAIRIVGETPVSKISPRLAGFAARKAAKRARIAFRRGDIPGTVEARSQELLAGEVLRASIRAKEAIDAGLGEFEAVFKQDANLAKTRDVDLVNAARAVLASFGFGNAERQARDYLDQLRRYDPETFEEVDAMVSRAIANARDYRSIPYNDFAALRDTVGSLWHMARRSRQVEIDGQLFERDQVEAELEQRLSELTKTGPRPGEVKAQTGWDETKLELAGLRAALRRVESWAVAMDGGDPGGPFTRYFWNPVSEGAARYRVAKRDAMQKYLAIVKGIEKSLTTADIGAPELGYTFSGKAELLGAVLHTGNDSNLQKLLRGRGWGRFDEFGNLDRSRWDTFIARMHNEGVLTKEDYDFQQAVWDLFDELKPVAQRAHREMYGHYFDEVTARPFSTPFGEYRGGYVPAKVDPFIVQDASINTEKDVVQMGTPGTFPTTGRGFTKSRVEEYAAPLLMNVSFISSHIDHVLRFAHIGPPVRDVARFLISKSFKEAIDAFDGSVREDMLVPWLQRAAQQRIDTPSRGKAGRMMDRFFRELRIRTGLQLMSFNVLNALQQMTGLFPSSVKVHKRHLLGALFRYVRAPSRTAKGIALKSPFMATRQSAGVVEVQRRLDNILLNPSEFQKLQGFAKEHGYILSAATQGMVDTITWMGAYDQAVVGGANEADAVRQADSAVRLTQSSFAAEDLSRFEASSPFVRTFTQFYAWFNGMANTMQTEFTVTTRKLGIRQGAGRLMYIYLMVFALPNVLSDLLWAGLKGENPFDDEDDDGASWDDILWFFGIAQFRGATRLFPIAGMVVESLANQFNSKPYDNDIRTSPAIELVGSSVRATRAITDLVKERDMSELSRREIRDIFTMVGMATGLPVAPLAKPTIYLRDVEQGNVDPKGRIDFTRGLVTGQPGEQ
jgi:hypothetical protein